MVLEFDADFFGFQAHYGAFFADVSVLKVLFQFPLQICVTRDDIRNFDGLGFEGIQELYRVRPALISLYALGLDFGDVVDIGHHENLNLNLDEKPLP